MNHKMLFCLLLLVISLYGCNVTTSKKIGLETSSLGKLKAFMVGSYDSSEQAAKDSSYYDISLHMYPIWEMDKSTESIFLYVEQALSSIQDKPYRQRVYEVKQIADNNYESLVYTLDSPTQYIGLWKDPNKMKTFTKNNILLKEGCSVFLEDKGEYFEGSTKNQDCKSTMRGANYASSVVRIEADTLTSWDQGFDHEETQVWGATEGPYEFIRISTKYDNN